MTGPAGKNRFGVCSVAGDLDGDGVLDAIVGGFFSGKVSVFFGKAGQPLTTSPLTIQSGGNMYYLADRGPARHRRHS